MYIDAITIDIQFEELPGHKQKIQTDNFSEARTPMKPLKFSSKKEKHVK